VYVCVCVCGLKLSKVSRCGSLKTKSLSLCVYICWCACMHACVHACSRPKARAYNSSFLNKSFSQTLPGCAPQPPPKTCAHSTSRPPVNGHPQWTIQQTPAAPRAPTPTTTCTSTHPLAPAPTPPLSRPRARGGASGGAATGKNVYVFVCVRVRVCVCACACAATPTFLPSQTCMHGDASVGATASKSVCVSVLFSSGFGQKFEFANFHAI
jgi:hypothetical protein